MSISSPFIHRPVATTLLTIAIALAGGVAYRFLPVSPLPQVEFPTISVSASLPGASPQTMAVAVATPLERQFGRIAGVTEMTSSSSLGSTSITMQFDLNRDIDAAARDVQAAINAARGELPTNLPSNPSYRKVNPADAPILLLAMTSDRYDRSRMYDFASSILQQKLSQVEGVGQVAVSGGAQPAVRVEVNPTVLNNLGLGLEDVRTVLAAANALLPKGEVTGPNHTWAIATTDELLKAADYRKLLLTFRNGAAVRISDVATVVDSQENLQTMGLSDGKPAILLIIFRQPGANIIETVDRVIAMVPQLRALIPPAIAMNVVMDRTTTIRASVHDVEITLVLSILLVIFVVFLFLRDLRTTLIPSVAVPISLIGTFGAMYLLGYSIDNLSLMAMTIATGFVVDDAIVVIENITRYLEQGMTPIQASLKGAKEIGFTVMSISISLIAVFIPILLMGGIVGRLFREFAVTLSIAIAISMVVSLTTTPMMCAVLLRRRDPRQRGRLYRASERAFDGINWFYEHTLRGVLRHPLLTIMVLFVTMALTVFLYIKIPKGFFPQQDTGRLSGGITADQDISFAAMQALTMQFNKAVQSDPAVESIEAFAGSGGGPGGGSANSARMFVGLKDLAERQHMSTDQVIARIRAKTSRIPGAQFVPQANQDLRIGGRSSAAQYQYTLQGDTFDELNLWGPQMMAKMKAIPGMADVNSDQQDHGLQTSIDIDRPTAARLKITPAVIDSVLYDHFGQRQVSTYYTPLNQYHVVMEVDPKFAQGPQDLNNVYVQSSTGKQVPLAAFARYAPSTTALSLPHQGQFPAVTISFNLLPGVSLGDVEDKILDAARQLGMPASIHGKFAGTAQAFLDSLRNQLWLVLAALATVYIVLGILYESYVHPITILSTLPSAGVGALLALLLFGQDLTVIAMIGIILLIGIVKKNAIMMIDFALEAERNRGLPPDEAIFQACLLRFRPITMTTMAAMLGGLPLALGRGNGAELRQPLGIAIVGGLLFSQALTLYTTPVVYLYLDRFRLWVNSFRRNPGAAAETPMAHPV